MKRILAFLPAFLCLCCLVLSAAAADDTVTVDFLKVGKADCTVIRYAGHVYMIDTATENKADDILDFLDDSGIDSIDILFLSHYDKDHIGGAAELLESIPVGAVYTTAYAAVQSDALDALYDALDDAGITADAVTDETVLEDGKLTFTLYPPLAQDYESNDSSLVIRMAYGDTAMLFTGDIEQARIAALLSAGTDLTADLIKMPHHGAYDEGTEPLISAVNAQYAVITCSKDDKEDSDTEDALQDAGTEVYLTRKGAVTAVSDGRTVTVTQD